MSKQIYKHFKGGEYRKLCIAIDEPSGRDMVIYQSLETGKIWCRSKSQFFSAVLHEGNFINRFEYVRDEE